MAILADMVVAACDSRAGAVEVWACELASVRLEAGAEDEVDCEAGCEVLLSVLRADLILLSMRDA